MTEFKRIRELVLSLKKSEIRNVNKHLKSNSKNEAWNLSLQLFTYILKNSDSDASAAMQYLYGNENPIAFKKTLQRFYFKLLDILVSNEFLDDESVYSSRNQEVLLLKKRLFYYDTLSIHGLNDQAILLLNHIQKSALQVESYEYLVLILNRKMQRLGVRSSVHELEEIFAQIEKFTQCQQAISRANYFIAFYSSNQISTNKRKLDLNKLQEEISMNDLLIDRHKSKRLRLSNFQLRGLYYYLNGEFKLAKENYYNLLKYQVQVGGKIVKSSEELNCILNIVEFEMSTGDFGLAKSMFNNVDKVIVKSPYNLNIIKEMKFLVELYSGNTLKLIGHLDNIELENNEYENTKYLSDRISFYYAVSHFLNEDFSSSLKYLNSIRYLTKSNEVWNVNLRLLQIMNYLNQEKFIGISNQIDTFRKYIEKIKSNRNEQIKFKSILKVLATLEKFGFNYKRTYQDLGSFIDEIDSYEKKDSINYRDPYFIPFTSWFYSKLKNVPYDHEVAMKELQRRYKKTKLAVA